MVFGHKVGLTARFCVARNCHDCTEQLKSHSSSSTLVTSSNEGQSSEWNVSLRTCKDLRDIYGRNVKYTEGMLKVDMWIGLCPVPNCLSCIEITLRLSEYIQRYQDHHREAWGDEQLLNLDLQPIAKGNKVRCLQLELSRSLSADVQRRDACLGSPRELESTAHSNRWVWLNTPIFSKFCRLYVRLWSPCHVAHWRERERKSNALHATDTLTSSI